MENEIFDIYKYLDSGLKKEREFILKKFIENEEVDDDVLNFFDLEFYSKSDRKSLLNYVSKSLIDSNITLTVEQVEILHILEQRNLFLSAPTSFGKTFIILEYIKRHEKELNNIVFVVPTLALMNELLKKIYLYFSNDFNICINSEEKVEEKNIFIFVPERNDSFLNSNVKNLEIDLVVFDEIYKLQKKKTSGDDRIILMNKTYLYSVRKAKRIVMLGPFIKDIEFSNTNLNAVKFLSNYSPVCNNIYPIQSSSWVNEIDEAKPQLIYFSSPGSIYKNITDLINCIGEDEKYVLHYKNEIKYLSKIVHENWYFVELLKRGIGIHHGKTPMFLRKFYENEFNAGRLKALLCTSTLMEGINTPTEKLIIVDSPSSAFEFYNLIGRVARLNPSNPKIGEVCVCDKKAFERYAESDGWRELKILAEEKNASNGEEALYFGTEIIDEEKKNDFKNKVDYLTNECGISLDEIKAKNLKLDKVYDFYKNDYAAKFQTAGCYKDCVVLAVKLLLNISHLWSKNLFDHLEITINYLPYKTYVSELLNGKKISKFVEEFNRDFNKQKNVNNINVFVDSIFETEKALKFRLSKILDYIDLSRINVDDNQFLSSFYRDVKRYDKTSTVIKILNDLGIEENDSETISRILNIDDSDISTSKVIKRLIDENNEIINTVSSPFSILNIKSLK